MHSEWVRALAASPGDMSLIPGTHCRGKLTPVSHLRVSACVPWHVCPHMWAQMVNKCKKLNKNQRGLGRRLSGRLVALAKDLGSGHSTHTVAHDHP